MDTEVMLTTFDNPFDPFDDFLSWWMFDNEMGYNTCGLIARIARYSDEFSLKEEDEDRRRAIDQIIDYDDLNLYKKVFRNPVDEEKNN